MVICPMFILYWFARVPCILCGQYWYLFLNCITFCSIFLSIRWIVCGLLERSFSPFNPSFLYLFQYLQKLIRDMCTCLHMSVTFHPSPRLRLIHHLLIFSKSRLYCIWCNNTPYFYQVEECNRCHGIIQFQYSENYIQFLAFLKIGFKIPYHTVQAIVRELSVP